MDIKNLKDLEPPLNKGKSELIINCSVTNIKMTYGEAFLCGWRQKIEGFTCSYYSPEAFNGKASKKPFEDFKDDAVDNIIQFPNLGGLQ